MLKARFGQQLHEQLVSQIGASAGGAFLDEQSRAARGSHQRMIADNAMKFGPQAVNVRVAQTVDPMSGSGSALVRPAGARHFTRHADAGILRSLLSD